jgi:asparagine synthase (glutamine-hydrolysing)
MCGIAGYIHKENCTDTCNKIEFKIAELQECRGPEAITSTYSKMGQFNVHLFHQRLRIQDLSAKADQPMKSSINGNASLVFNGEIYNFEEMRLKFLPELIMKTHSDTEILVESLVTNNLADVLESIRGMFAFGKLDLANKELILARDRFGEKPLHYFVNDKSFVFASQFDSITETMKLLGQNIELNQNGIYEYLIYGYFPYDVSLVKNVMKLPPGGLLKLNFENEIEIHATRWIEKWKPKIKKKMPFSELEKNLTDAIGLQLIGDVPIGVFLSGGCDSTLVSVLAQKASSNPIHSFSLGFQNENFNESQYALKASSQIGTVHHSFTMTAADAKDILPKVLKAYPEPLGDPSVLPTAFISKAAREHVTVVLTGDGADELFFGYGRYSRFREIEKLQKLNFPLAAKIIQKSFIFAPSSIKSKLARLTNILKSEYLGMTYATLVGFPHVQSVLDQAAFDGVCSSSLTRLWQKGSSRDSVDKLREIDIDSYLTDDILVKVDRAAMAFSLETRAPFLDSQVVYLAENADETWLLVDSQKKVIKEILGQYVSKDIFMRKKMGFGAPLGDWFRTDLKPWVEQTVYESNWKLIGIDKTFVQSIYIENQDGDDSNVTYLWMLLCLASAVARL